MKAIYELKQSPRAWFEKFSITISGIGFHRYHSDRCIFVRRTKSYLVILTVYGYDILLAESDSDGLMKTKKYFRHMTKDMANPKYFLRIEVAHQKYEIPLSQRKYNLDLLEETGFLGCKPASTPMETNADFDLIVITSLMIQEGIED